ncbi:MAG TPA: CoA transferase [Acidimicrobiales bacterium]|nr:CoA transferase [Acidimicrobiales bacterium]
MTQPLDGVRILAAEQMQALPYATQLLARMGADVVKVEPITGESGRGSQPSMKAPDGSSVGATFLRNNLDKRSVAIDLRSDAGKDLFRRLVPKFDVVAENFKAGAMDRLGLGYDALAKLHPPLIYVSVSGFGNRGDSPYRDWPAYSAIVEAMSGIYEFTRRPGMAPRANPVGALGDISSGLYAVIGILTALRHRDRTGEGQHVDIAMYDATVAMTDIVTGLGSMGVERLSYPAPMILDTFKTKDGWFVMQLVREHQFERLATVVGHPEWVDDPRFATRAGWGEHLESVLRPGIEAWAAQYDKREACEHLAAAGLAVGPCLESGDVMHEPHLEARNMLIALDRTDDVEQPVLLPGNPVKLSAVPEDEPQRPPWLGEHTADVLRDELGLDDAEIKALVADGVVSIN